MPGRWAWCCWRRCGCWRRPRSSCGAARPTRPTRSTPPRRTSWVRRLLHRSLDVHCPIKVCVLIYLPGISLHDTFVNSQRWVLTPYTVHSSRVEYRVYDVRVYSTPVFVCETFSSYFYSILVESLYYIDDIDISMKTVRKS